MPPARQQAPGEDIQLRATDAMRRALLPAGNSKTGVISSHNYIINPPDAAWKLLTTDKIVTSGTAL